MHHLLLKCHFYTPNVIITKSLAHIEPKTPKHGINCIISQNHNSKKYDLYFPCTLYN